ncbi:4'-phosphopantetheinyl transferase [Streptomyces sp. NPDC059165]|uniref:4'-phosphopantetheinyl transferase family protein n=1 Tax=Streptomyces sp. NPDC059165 TaxID=3346751 RepID=UPI0036BF0438
MIGALVPAPVVAVDTVDEGGEGTLCAEAFRLVQHAAPVRRKEFSAVRACARTALAGLGLPPVPVLPGCADRPLARGVVGSMTRCDGYRAAAVAPAAAVHTVGIDAEPDLPLPTGVPESIATPYEAGWVAATPTGGPVNWSRLLFSAKECVDRAWFPLTREEPDLPDATIDARITSLAEAGADHDARGVFTARLRRRGRTSVGRPATRFDGRLRGGAGRRGRGDHPAGRSLTGGVPRTAVRHREEPLRRRSNPPGHPLFDPLILRRSLPSGIRLTP